MITITDNVTEDDKGGSEERKENSDGGRRKENSDAGGIILPHGVMLTLKGRTGCSMAVVDAAKIEWQ